MSTTNTTTTATGYPDSIEASLLLIAEAVQKMNKEKKTRPKAEDEDRVFEGIVVFCVLMLFIVYLIKKIPDDEKDQKDKKDRDNQNDGNKIDKINMFRLDLNIKTECSCEQMPSGRHHGHYYVPPYAVPPEYQPRHQNAPRHEDTY